MKTDGQRAELVRRGFEAMRNGDVAKVYADRAQARREFERRHDG